MNIIRLNKIIILASVLFVSGFFSTYSQQNERIYSIYLNITAVADDAEKQGREIVDFAEAAGGYYLRLSDYDVSIRIPQKSLNSFEEFLKKSTSIIEYNIRTDDLKNDYLILKKQVSAREKMLSDLMGMINNADLKNTLGLEKEIMSLLYEIEAIKGRIRMIEAEASLARIDIYFSSDSFERPVKTESAFSWINNVDFYTFITPEDKY